MTADTISVLQERTGTTSFITWEANDHKFQIKYYLFFHTLLFFVRKWVLGEHPVESRFYSWNSIQGIKPRPSTCKAHVSAFIVLLPLLLSFQVLGASLVIFCKKKTSAFRLGWWLRRKTSENTCRCLLLTSFHSTNILSIY